MLLISKNKKKALFGLLLSIFLFLLTVVGVSSHPPSISNLSYDAENEQITVNISHGVSDTNSHYVESIEIKVDDVSKISESYTSQPSASSFSEIFDLVVPEGALIEVTADCNQYGSDSDSITVTSEQTNGSGETGEESGISGFTGIGWFGIFVIGSLAIFISKKSDFKREKEELGRMH